MVLVFFLFFKLYANEVFWLELVIVRILVVEEFEKCGIEVFRFYDKVKVE